MPSPLIQSSFSETIVTTFTDGDCWVLAEQIREDMSFPIVTVSGKSDAWFHAGNQLPDGTILDIEGVWLREDWLARWVESFLNLPAVHPHMFVKTWADGEFTKLVKETDLEPYYPQAQRVHRWSGEVLALAGY